VAVPLIVKIAAALLFAIYTVYPALVTVSVPPVIFTFPVESLWMTRPAPATETVPPWMLIVPAELA